MFCTCACMWTCSGRRVTSCLPAFDVPSFDQPSLVFTKRVNEERNTHCSAWWTWLRTPSSADSWNLHTKRTLTVWHRCVHDQRTHLLQQEMTPELFTSKIRIISDHLEMNECRNITVLLRVVIRRIRSWNRINKWLSLIQEIRIKSTLKSKNFFMGARTRRDRWDKKAGVSSAWAHTLARNYNT